MICTFEYIEIKKNLYLFMNLFNCESRKSRIINWKSNIHYIWSLVVIPWLEIILLFLEIILHQIVSFGLKAHGKKFTDKYFYFSR